MAKLAWLAWHPWLGWLRWLAWFAWLGRQGWAGWLCWLCWLSWPVPAVLACVGLAAGRAVLAGLAWPLLLGWVAGLPGLGLRLCWMRWLDLLGWLDWLGWPGWFSCAGGAKKTLRSENLCLKKIMFIIPELG